MNAAAKVQRLLIQSIATVDNSAKELAYYNFNSSFKFSCYSIFHPSSTQILTVLF